MAATNATQRRAHKDIVAGKGDSCNLKTLVSTVEVAAEAASADTLNFGKIPTSARLAGGRVYTDIVSTTAATLDIGLAGIDPEAINDGIAISSATDVRLVKDAANVGLPVWDLVNAQTSDPGGAFEVYGTLKDATVEGGGTVTVEINYYMD